MSITARRKAADARRSYDGADVARQSTRMPQPGPFQIARDGQTLRIVGDLRMHDAAAIWRDVHGKTNDATGALVLDLSGVRAADGSVMALLVELRNELAARGVKAELVGANEAVETVVKLYAGHEGVVRVKARRPMSTVAQVGQAAFDVKEEARGILGFFGSMLLTAGTLLRHPRAGHWKEVAPLCERSGADAVPIVLLINFLVGSVMAFQSANQLKQFGANIYVADLVGISLTRELAPLMTAIIVCGRSGAAFAAELGSMKVNEEIDALRTLGLTPFGWLVVPRVIALLLVVPVLTLIADFVGIAGGLVVGITDLDLTTQGYLVETLKAVHGWDVVTGLMKSVVFSVAIALIACQQGFAATGGAEGVGKRTTSTVVTSLFALVLIDAFFTAIFRAFDV
jgi:phospholipid/cholesterol/gamma-HCH transport system permease protein